MKQSAWYATLEFHDIIHEVQDYFASFNINTQGSSHHYNTHQRYGIKQSVY